MSPISSCKDSAITARKFTSLHLSADYSQRYLGGPRWARPVAASGIFVTKKNPTPLGRAISRWWREKSELWWFRHGRIHAARVYRTIWFLHTSPLSVPAEQKRNQPSLWSVLVATDVLKTSLPATQRWWIRERSVIGFWLCTQHQHAISQSGETPQDRLFILTTKVMKNGSFFQLPHVWWLHSSAL